MIIPVLYTIIVVLVTLRPMGQAIGLHLINAHGRLIHCHLSGLWTIAALGTLLFMASTGMSSETNYRIIGNETAEEDNLSANDNGPTVLLSYSKETFQENPISSFMYFIPLISPTGVDRQTSANNQQQVGIVTYERRVTSKSFSVICEFEMLGTGFHKNTFDPVGMMALFINELEEGETLTHMLDYIQFEGEGLGRIEVMGTITGSIQTVTEVDVRFNARGHKSPVTIGLYDVKPRDGQYRYENRSNQVVARVNSLLFKKSEKDPRMGIKVASIGKNPDLDVFWASIKGAIANLFIRPPLVDKLGNDTMLEFGYAVLKQKSEFVFPKAKHIQEDMIAAMGPAKN